MRIKLLAILALALSLMSACSKPSEKKVVAFLVPFENRTQIWQSIVDSAREEFSDTSRYELKFFYVYEYVGRYYEKREYERDVTPLLNNVMNYVRRECGRPDLMIIYGDAISHAAARSKDPLLSEVPLLCVGVVDPQWKDLLPSKSNVVVMESTPEVKKNLDFIQAMGHPNFVVTVMDSTYVDDHIRAHILEQIGDDTEHYRPNLHLEQDDRILSKNQRDHRTTLFPISTMWPEKNDRHPGIKGGFDLKWVFYTQQQGTSFLHIKNDCYADLAMSYNIGPFFTMTPEYFDLPLINAMNFCIGGYFTPFPSMWEQIHPTVDKLLDGTSPKQIPWGVLEKDYWLDWRLVKNMHPYASDFPKGVRFVHLPWEKKSPAIIASFRIGVVLLIVLFLVIAVVIPLILVHKSRKQRRQLYAKAAEAENNKKRVEFILSELNAYIWRMMPDGSVVFSPSFYDDFSINRDKVLHWETAVEYIQEPGRSKLKKAISGEAIEGETDFELIIKMPGTESTRAILLHQVSIDTAKDEKETINIKAGFFYFNDEEYSLKEELRNAYRRSEEISEKEQFLASMNDEFQKPADRIVFYSKLLSERYNELSASQKAEYGAEVMSANKELIQLLNEVMGDAKDSRLDKGVQLQVQKASTLMEEIYVAHSPYCPEGVSLEFAPGPADSEIYTNRPVMIQVMNNLLSNAFESCKGRIELGWSQVPGQDVVLFIDNADGDISLSTNMVESIGGSIRVLGGKVSSGTIRIEMSFPSTPPFRF